MVESPIVLCALSTEGRGYGQNYDHVTPNEASMRKFSRCYCKSVYIYIYPTASASDTCHRPLLGFIRQFDFRENRRNPWDAYNYRYFTSTSRSLRLSVQDLRFRVQGFHQKT